MCLLSPLEWRPAIFAQQIQRAVSPIVEQRTEVPGLEVQD